MLNNLKSFGSESTMGDTTGGCNRKHKEEKSTQKEE